MSSNVKDSKERDNEAAPASDVTVIVEVGNVSDTKGGFGPYPDAGVGGTAIAGGF